MIRRKLIAVLFGFSLSIFLVVPGAHASPTGADVDTFYTPPESVPTMSEKVYDGGAFINTWGLSPDMLINCDPQNDLLAKMNPGSVQTFRKLQTGACRAQTFNDSGVQYSGNPDLQGTTKAKGYTGLSGESNMIKINPVSTDVRYVYLQCGKKVGTFGPPTCSCGSNWRYTYNCAKPKTVYITIPCH